MGSSHIYETGGTLGSKLSICLRNRHHLQDTRTHCPQQHLTDTQHGFRWKRSCETQLTFTIHRIAKQLAKGFQVDVIFLDFSKAFDKVPDACLLQKLDYYGVRGNIHNWNSERDVTVLENVHRRAAHYVFSNYSNHTQAL